MLLEYLNAETCEICAVQEQRIHLLSYQIIQKVFITISGSVGFYIIRAWANQVIKIFIGRRIPHWLNLIIMESMSICSRSLMLENISTAEE